MPEFQPNTPIETDVPTIEVTVTATNPLRVGRHRFRLSVFDDSGNESLPDEVDVIVRDTERPTAVIAAPREVPFGQSFALSGERSSDVGGGQVVRYTWTLVEVV